MSLRVLRYTLSPDETWRVQDALLDFISEDLKETLRINHPEKFSKLYNVIELIATNAALKEAAYLQNREPQEVVLPRHPRFWEGKDRWKDE